MALTVGSLFSGIGGIDLGLERAGMVTRWFCEIDPHCRNVLARHWPGPPVYGDIGAVDWSGVESVDVLAGGFPCQPVSNAGKRLGTDDARWLWPEFARAIRALRPRYVLVENVAALLGRGFEHVITDLAAFGYDAEWDCIPAAAVGAPHLRDRLWTVAYASGVQPLRGSESTRTDAARHTRARALPGRSKARPLLADAASIGRGEGRPESAWEQGRPSTPVGSQPLADTDRPRSARLREHGWTLSQATTRLRSGTGERSPSRGVFTDSNGESLGRLAESRGQRGQWATEPDVGRVADGVPHRVDRLRALGNAVVPQVVEWIGRRIVAFDEGVAA